MVFSSATFLLVFLPITLAIYYLVPFRAARNVILLIMSLVFYAWGEPVYVVLMIASMTFNWFFALLIGRTPRARRLWLTLAIVANLAVLGFFKYEGFLAQNINALLGFSCVPDLQLPLPIGISFYTLQALTYVVDVYRKQVPVQPNPLYVGMYIAMFPQLVAGPIVRYATIEEQILHRRENFRDFAAGARLFCVGLAKKVLLANTVAILATAMLAKGGAAIGFIGTWGGLVAFTFQIFFDFSGYSDMAIGLGKMFGFQYLRNFNYPYISQSVTEFWRRWHISLSSFFRDYLYIPLGGNRVSKPRWIFNLTVVWALTGFWHGAAYNFILWGLYYLALLLLEKFFLLSWLQKLPRFFRHCYGILTFLFGWLIFWVEDMSTAPTYLSALFGGYGWTGSSTFWELQVWNYLLVFLICAIASTPVVPWLRAQLIAWAKGQPLKGFSSTDLPDTKHLSTAQLCDYDFYLDELKPDALANSFEDPKDTHYANTTKNAKGAQNTNATLIQKRSRVVGAVFLGCDVGLLVFLALAVMAIAAGSFNPFIYFRF